MTVYSAVMVGTMVVVTMVVMVVGLVVLQAVGLLVVLTAAGAFAYGRRSVQAPGRGEGE